MSNVLDLSDFYKVTDIRWYIGSTNRELEFNNGNFNRSNYYSVFINGIWIPFASYGKNYLGTDLMWAGNTLINTLMNINKGDYAYIPYFIRSLELIKELAWNTLANLSEEDVAYIPVLTNIVNS